MQTQPTQLDEITLIKQEVDKIKTGELKDNPKDLINTALKLSAYKVRIGELLHDAQMNYASTYVSLKKDTTAKMSIKDAEYQADEQTLCNKDKLKYLREDIQEIINVIKLKVKVLQEPIDEY